MEKQHKIRDDLYRDSLTLDQARAVILAMLDETRAVQAAKPEYSDYGINGEIPMAVVETEYATQRQLAEEIDSVVLAELDKQLGR
ncbi:hypothetical protein [Streptomyces niveus]|uniref:hypothetical protein n=1 Tax=Streptomyces niveus TaxID=193462 RepID=UPI003430D741